MRFSGWPRSASIAQTFMGVMILQAMSPRGSSAACAAKADASCWRSTDGIGDVGRVCFGPMNAHDGLGNSGTVGGICFHAVVDMPLDGPRGCSVDCSGCVFEQRLLLCA